MAARAFSPNNAVSPTATPRPRYLPRRIPMQYVRVLVAALATAALCAFAAPSRASLGTNFTDQWWNPNESGWGASVSQQFNTLFIDLFVYGSDGRPTWYTAAVYLDPQNEGLFTGDLYATTGPWFGAFFNPS